MGKYKVGDRVIGKNAFGKNKLSLVIKKVFAKKNIYLCQVDNTNVCLPYLEGELEKKI